MESLHSLFRSLRIPYADAENYVSRIIELGYDDINAFDEDISLSELEGIMKPSTRSKTAQHKIYQE